MYEADDGGSSVSALDSRMKTVPVRRAPGANASRLKHQNQRTLLKLLHQCEGLSRADLARRAGLNPSTVTALAAELVKAGIVRERGPAAPSSVGRRPTLLELVPDARFAVGVFVGDLSCFGVITNLRGNIVDSFRIETPSAQEPQVSIERVVAEVRAMIARWSGPQARLLGIGVGIPGLVDSGGGIVVYSPNLGWMNVSARSLLQDALQLPVFIDNDANALALGELWFGSGRQVHSLVCMHFDTGLGCGVVVDGRIYRGSTGGGGEIGHTVIDPDGPFCRCGKQGCLEVLASGRAIVAKATQGLVSAVPSSLRNVIGSTPGQLSLTQIFAAARQGDRLAQTAIAQTIKYTGMAVANAINTFDPELVVLSGELLDEGADFILDTIVEAARVQVFGAAARVQTPILVTKLAKRVSALGPACLVLQQRFADIYEMGL